MQALLLSQAQLQLTKTFVPTSANPGDTVQVLLDYTNIGQLTGQSVALYDVLPAGLTYVDST